MTKTDPLAGGPGMDTTIGATWWQSCRIERILTRARWPGRARQGLFIAVLDDDVGDMHYLSRSEQFTVPSPTDADIAAFHALVAILAEEGWQTWRGPGVPIGFDAFDRGYWSVTLRRPIVAQEAPDMAPSRTVRDPAMEALRERAIARLREEKPPVRRPANPELAQGRGSGGGGETGGRGMG